MVAISDDLRKRITLSSNQKLVRIETLSVSAPLKIERFKKWTHIVVDLEEIVCFAWRKEKLRSIISVSLSGIFVIRKIFTVKREMILAREGSFEINYDELPKKMRLSKKIPQIFRLISSPNADFEYQKDTPQEFDSSSLTSGGSTISSSSSCRSNRFSIYSNLSNSTASTRSNCRTISSVRSSLHQDHPTANFKSFPSARTAENTTRRYQGTSAGAVSMQEQEKPAGRKQVTGPEINLNLLLSGLTFSERNSDLQSNASNVSTNSSYSFSPSENASNLYEKDTLSKIYFIDDSRMDYSSDLQSRDKSNFSSSSHLPTVESPHHIKEEFSGKRRAMEENNYSTDFRLKIPDVAGFVSATSLPEKVSLNSNQKESIGEKYLVKENSAEHASYLQLDASDGTDFATATDSLEGNFSHLQREESPFKRFFIEENDQESSAVLQIDSSSANNYISSSLSSPNSTYLKQEVSSNQIQMPYENDSVSSLNVSDIENNIYHIASDEEHSSDLPEKLKEKLHVNCD